MGRYSYTGDDERVYPGYRDVGAGTTLVAEPGGSYEIAAPDEAPVPPPDGRWAAKPARKTSQGTPGGEAS